MKKPSRLLAVLLAVCVAAAFPPVGLAAGTVHTISDNECLMAFLKKDEVQDGDVIRCNGSVFVAPDQNTDDPWVIGKRVTIEGGTLLVNTGGIVLGADVTFKDTQLMFGKPICNAIVANGYTLTLDNVQAYSSGKVFNVFCGTLLPNNAQQSAGFQVPAPGSTNTVIIRGNTNLRSGSTSVVGESNIYAGSLSLGSMSDTLDEAGKPSDFSASPTIRIEGSDNAQNPLGAIYACGAQQRNTFGVGAQKFTTRDLSQYIVSGAVTIEGGNKLPDVYGATSSDGRGTANVRYQGDGNRAEKTFQNISGLLVESGKLALNQDSYFQDSGTLTLNAGAKLLLSSYPAPIPNFHGSDGILILDQNQTLLIRDSAVGTAKVAIGDTKIGDAESTGAASSGHTYIQAPIASSAVFQLLPYSTQPNMTLERNDSGGWVATDGSSGGEESKLIGLNPAANTRVPSGETEAMIPLNPSYTGTGLYLSDFLSSIQITVNDRTATFTEDTDSPEYSCFEAAGLQLYIGNYDEGEFFAIYNADDFASPVPDGSYTIQITVPGAYTQSGSAVTASCTLTVGDTTDPDVPISIPVPTAVTGLKYTGQTLTGVSEGTGYTLTGHQAIEVGSYTATATPQNGYQWSDGGAEAKTIPWSIAKADGPAAPTGIFASAPTMADGADGKISGVSAAMEYASKADFSDRKDCGGNEITGLAAGTYYVRLKETATHGAGAYAMITVPAYGAPTVQSIRVNSTDHKTEYKVGDSLDVLKLTIEVTFSNGDKQTVPVTAAMVTGFDASQAAESQVLTITYEGKATTYTVKISANQQPGGQTYKLTLSNTGAGGTASAEYQYAEGDTVTVRAGTRSGYAFSAWDAVGVTLSNRSVPDVSFQMPAGDVSLSVIWRPNSITPPGHVHSWDTAWSSNSTHHWHNCTASGCSIEDNAQKSGYAPHTAGDWIVDQPATASQSGVRHQACTVCGYEMARETIPATGGSSGGSGGSSGGSSGSSGGSSSPSGPSGSSAASVKNPDGSTTTTSTNRSTGTVTETTRRPDGSTTVVETKRDGTVTTTDTAADGSTFKTVARPNGVTETTIHQSGGLTATVWQRPGSDRANIRIPAKLAEESGSVILPIPALSGENASVTVHTGSSRPVAVEIPAHGDAATTVAALTGPDGRETIVKTALLSGGQITVSVPDGATVRIRNNRKNFQDAANHWAKSSIDFVTARELFSGTSAGAFSPDASMSRAMLATVLARLDGAELSGGSVYQQSMAWAVSRGISDGRNPGAQVTREQLVTMLYRYTGSPAATERELRFSDAESISSYAREAVRWAAENGILSGYEDGSFAPGGRATRAQTAAILARYVQFLNRQI